MADEVESHHTEQLPICVRFADKECNIREEFLEFGKCVQTNGESIFKELMRIIEKAGLDIELCRGQGYDGASNMSSETVGVQKRIVRKSCLHTLLWSQFKLGRGFSM